MAEAVFGGPTSIKLQLEGQTFGNLLQLQRETNKIIRGYSTAWFSDITCIKRQWPERYQRCVFHFEEYFEKKVQLHFITLTVDNVIDVGT